MRRTIIALATAAAVAAGGIGAAGAETAAEVNSTLDSLFGSHTQYQQFFEKLKEAVAGDDKKAVASLVDYPFRARINGKAVTIKDANHFVADYNKIVTGKVKQAVTEQRYETLFANWQGVMIGDGEVWFSGIGDNDTVKIIAIND
jgi:cyclopropane fatty-acyl-phospholipid synthase-like methyltransferase